MTENAAPEEGFDTEALARAIAEAAWERKARSLRILDVRRIVSYADYIVVCHGTSERHARSIAGHVVEDLRSVGIRPARIEGQRTGDWLLIDYVDVVVHVFDEPYRSEFAIESIYADAPRLALNPPADALSEEEAEAEA